MERITIRSYPKTWAIENRIYAVMNMRLPRPVEPRLFLYYAGTLLLVLLLCRILPFLRGAPPALRYIVLPGGTAYLLLKAKLDGKAPIRFFLSLIRYLGRRGQYVAGFTYRVPHHKSKLRWFCRHGSLRKEVVTGAPVPD